MINFSCTYMGLRLRNPIVIGSSGLTASIDNLKSIESNGAGAVILKSIFEEQIRFESGKLLQSSDPDAASWQKTFNEIVDSKEYFYDEAYEYLTGYAKEHTLSRYLALITDAKKHLSIPVIASINCNTMNDWQFFARRIQDAGADALELNVYVLPSDFEKTGQEIEETYFSIIREIRKYVTIPVSLKTGFYFSGLARTLLALSETGIAGLTLFNRPYNPDIDIDTLHVSSSNRFSTPGEYSHTLRWVALLSGRLGCDIAASTGIHDHEAVIKQLLAGATVTQLVSAFYRNESDFSYISRLTEAIGGWMKEHGFREINDFRGMLSSKNISNPASYERVQFLRLFSGAE